MKTNKKVVLFVLTCMSTWGVQAKTTITSAQIIPSVLSPTCMEYKIVGKCFWLFCTYVGGCRVRTSVKVKHYIPDVVVSSYANTYQNPWQEVSSLNIPNSSAQGGNDTNSRQANEKSKIKFKEVDIYGHPGGATFSNLVSGMGYYCKNGVTPYMPYFISSLDFLAWRSVLIESFYPESLTIGMREIGSQAAGNMWSNVYPRAGAVVHSNDYIAGAVAAQRGADVVTRNGQPHIYVPYTKHKSDGFWPPDPVRENNQKNHKWQMLAPSLEKTCSIFPNKYTTKRLSDDGAYVFSLWRPYACCKRKGQTFLYSIDFAQ